jgi:hypothetical protein
MPNFRLKLRATELVEIGAEVVVQARDIQAARALATTDRDLLLELAAGRWETVGGDGLGPDTVVVVGATPVADA